MIFIWGVTILFYFGIQFLLLLGAAQMCRKSISLLRIMIASAYSAAFAWLLMRCRIGSAYSVMLLPVMLLGTCAIGLGHRFSCWSIYLLLYLALEGVRASIQCGGILPMMFSALVVFGLSILCAKKESDVVSVRIRNGEKEISMKALRDNGNTLRDPISGDSVIIIASTAAQRLTGLTAKQIEDPLGTIQSLPIPGLRLVPYQAIGQKNGLLLAKCFPNVFVGSVRKSALVAFAPSGLENCGFEALTGGM